MSRRRAPAAGQHLPAADHRGLRPVRGRRDSWPTCTTSASTGSTCRRCWRPSRAARTGTTWSTSRGSTSPAAAPRGWPRCPPRPGGSASACSSTSCPTTSAWPRPPQNAWWWDVLRLGRDSAYAEAFDVDWDFGDGRLRIPVVGDDDLRSRTARIAEPVESPTASCATTTTAIPIAPGVSTGSTDGDDGDANAVHARQHYELVGWRRADAELNYRRFFSVNTLAGVRVEMPEVFAADPRRDRPLVRRGPRRRAARRPPRRAARPARLPRRPRRG